MTKSAIGFGTFTIVLGVLLVWAAATRDRSAHNARVINYRSPPVFTGKVVYSIGDNFDRTAGMAWLDDQLILSDLGSDELRYCDSLGYERKRRTLERYPDTIAPVENPGPACLVPLGQQLLVCDQGNRRLSLLRTTGDPETLVTSYDYRRLNGPHGAALGAGPDVYFTDPPEALPGRQLDRSSGLSFSGVYRLNLNTRRVTLESKQLSHPAGVAYWPDPHSPRLYVANADPFHAYWLMFRVRPDGSLEQPGAIFADATRLVGSWPGSLGAVLTDRDGHVIAAAPAGIHVYSPGGELLQLLQTTEPVQAMMWGCGALYFTSGTHLYRAATMHATAAVNCPAL